MVKYGRYTVNGDLEIINTVNPVSEDKLVEKGLMPVVVDRIIVDDVSLVKPKNMVVIDGVVKEIVYEFVKPISLDEAKGDKIKTLKSYISGKILSKYPDYKQRSASLGLYSDEEVSVMKDFIKGMIGYCNEKEDMILSLGDMDSVVSFDFLIEDSEGV